MASTGMRIGAIHDLKIKHVKPVDNHPIYCISVYDRTPYEYFTYCTPELRRAIDAYLEYRKRSGEVINPESPLLRELFDSNDKKQVNSPRHLKTSTITSLMADLLVKSGLRSATGNRKERKEVMLNHGLRKFFFKTCGKSDMNPIIRELLMGHKTGNMMNGVTNLMVTYDATEDNEILQAYLKAIPDLTINQEERIKVELAKKEKENTELYIDIDKFRIALEQLERQGLIK